jgi:hypothetical protein
VEFDDPLVYYAERVYVLDYAGEATVDGRKGAQTAGNPRPAGWWIVICCWWMWKRISSPAG